MPKWRKIRSVHIEVIVNKSNKSIKLHYRDEVPIQSFCDNVAGKKVSSSDITWLLKYIF